MEYKYQKNNMLSAKLQAWFRQNCRDLPWRNTRNPYLIWVSEIILQQTRVAQGLDYYNRFVERFPDVLSLAESDETEVLKYWQGLGYYSRARNMHAAARQIKMQHAGAFPQQYAQVLALKGVGDYTAAAICSFAYNQPYAVLDGNVFRVLARLFGIETPINAPRAKREFSELAQNLLDKTHSAVHNQAIMEFGALQCTPQSPDCGICPLQEICNAFCNKKVNMLPVKLKKATAKERFFNYFFVKNGDFTYLKKRESNDIWKNLYEFPLIETATASYINDLLVSENFREIFADSGKIDIAGLPFVQKHVLTHRIIHAVFYIINIEGEPRGDFTKILQRDLHEYPVSRLVELFLERC
ncbi:MAG: A/G-specific adenine glycosylase [Prevotellaceae bacterium]|jgi:A/G-specific adenine glycosylase|nr:A/G-specific adenine glycosylase [Prevotellaceae bacterium]